MSLPKKNKVKLLIAVVIVIVLGVFIGYKIMYKPHKTLTDFDVKFSGLAENFTKKVKHDAAVWQNVVVELTGTITAKDAKGITLNNTIYCQFENVTLLPKVKEGETLKIKGRMMGYDDLLEELKLDKTIILE